jgi:hypothetical protein
MTTRHMKIHVDFEPQGSEFSPGDIHIFADNVTGFSGPQPVTVKTVEAVGPAVQAMVEHNVRNMIANAENELKPINEKKARLEAWLANLASEPLAAPLTVGER